MLTKYPHRVNYFMKSQTNPELKTRLRTSVEDFVSFLESEHDGEIPKKKIFCVEDGKVITESAPDFANLVNSYTDDPEDIFSDVVDWLVSSGSGYRESNERGEYISDFVYLTGSVLQYSGSYTVTDESYNLAFEQEMRRQYNIPRWKKVIVPIYNFNMGETNLSLATDLEFIKNNDSVTTVSKLEVGAPTLKEIAGIRNWSYMDGGYDDGFKEKWRNVVRLELTSRDFYGIPQIITSMIINSIRMFQPKEVGPDIGNFFEMYPNGISHRLDVDYFGGVHHHQPQRTSFLSSMNRFTDTEEFRSFWDEYKDWFYDGTDPLGEVSDEYPVKSTQISQPLRRLSQSFEKERLEDALIDLIIGFESTLIKDGGRLAERGVVLLENENPEFIYGFLKEVWQARNGIVHHDNPLTSIQINGATYESGAIIKETRYILTNVILRYIDLLSDFPDMNITQINQNILQKRVIDRLTKED